jgi:hypothetical protein
MASGERATAPGSGHFFGANTELHTIRVPEIQDFANWLATQPVRKGKPRRKGDPPKRTLSPGSQRKYLNTVSNLFRRAQAENVVPVGHNAVAAMLEKPVAARTEGRWLESPSGTRSTIGPRTAGTETARSGSASPESNPDHDGDDREGIPNARRLLPPPTQGRRHDRYEFWQHSVTAATSRFQKLKNPAAKCLRGFSFPQCARRDSNAGPLAPEAGSERWCVLNI